MVYEIQTNSMVIGTSDLQHADPSMGIRYGSFNPTEDYYTFKPVFDEYFRVISNMPKMPGTTVPEFKPASDKVRELNLTLFTTEGKLVPVEHIEITDCTSEPELSNEPIEISVMVKNNEIYEKVFGN